MNELLTNDNFILYCAHYYSNPQCAEDAEFFEDLNRIKYIKKLITRYKITNDLKERLILNHIIILNNVFGPVVTARILYFKLSQEFKYIKPFLVLLNICPDKLYNLNTLGSVIDLNEVELDENIVTALRNI